MKRYRTEIDLPDDIREFIDTINEQGHAQLDAKKQQIVIEFDADDEYELAMMVNETQTELQSLGYQSLVLDRPEFVADLGEGSEPVSDGTDGQDRESYADDQDRESYTVDEIGDALDCTYCRRATDDLRRASGNADAVAYCVNHGTSALLAIVESRGLKDYHLAELVTNSQRERADKANKEGVRAQIALLIGNHGESLVRELLHRMPLDDDTDARSWRDSWMRRR